jgi:hypothetical protein
LFVRGLGLLDDQMLGQCGIEPGDLMVLRPRIVRA